MSLRRKHDWAVRILLSAQQQDARAREQPTRALVSADTVTITYASAVWSGRC